MSHIGPFTARDLGDKLQNISLDEMQKFHLHRMKKYRLYTIIAFVIAILSTVIYFVFPSIRILTGILAILGFILIVLTKFKQQNWVRLYENLIYTKKRREKIVKKQDKTSHPHKTKFDN